MPSFIEDFKLVPQLESPSFSPGSELDHFVPDQGWDWGCFWQIGAALPKLRHLDLRTRGFLGVHVEQMSLWYPVDPYDVGWYFSLCTTGLFMAFSIVNHQRYTTFSSTCHANSPFQLPPLAMAYHPLPPLLFPIIHGYYRQRTSKSMGIVVGGESTMPGKISLDSG
jgi:hypothetical protein